MTDFIPDAVLASIGHSGSGDAASRLSKLQTEFSAVLNVPRVHVRHQGSSYFLTGSPTDTLLFPQADPRSGQPRYQWSDRGDGVSLGRLRADV